MTEAVQAAPISNDVPDTAIKVYAQNWVATIIASASPTDGYYPVNCDVRGSSREEALKGAQHILNAYAFGRKAYIRVEPEAVTHPLLDGGVAHVANVRFSYKLEPGEWSYPNKEPSTYFGEQH
jgi:hypothetical protein